MVMACFLPPNEGTGGKSKLRESLQLVWVGGELRGRGAPFAGANPQKENLNHQGLEE